MWEGGVEGGVIRHVTENYHLEYNLINPVKIIYTNTHHFMAIHPRKNPRGPLGKPRSARIPTICGDYVYTW